MFESYKENGTPQLLSGKGTLPLHSKYSNVTGSVSIPFELSADRTPIGAVRIYSGGSGMIQGLSLNTDAQANASGFRGSIGYSGNAADVYIFSNYRNRNGSTFGLQTFDTNGTLIFDAQDKPIRPVDIVSPNWTISAAADTNWTDSRWYDGGRQYAVAAGGVNRAYRYRWTGNRTFDTSQRQYVFSYMTDYAYMGVRFSSDNNIVFYTRHEYDADGWFEVENNNPTPPLGESWSGQTSGGMAMVLDVTGY